MKKLTEDNYFSHEMQEKYMGASQFKSFLSCEARALAEIHGEWVHPKTTALLVGSYVDAYFEGALERFKQENPEIFTRQGSLKSEFKKAEEIIQRIERDKFFMKFMSGKKQVIKTGEIEGIPFKIKIDSYHPGIMLVDLKVMKDFAPMWKEAEGCVTFIEGWGYDLQGAIYQAVEGDCLPFYIAAATKEPEPDIGVFQIPQTYLDVAMDTVKRYVHRFDGIKMGVVEPVRCEKCDYCKHTKVLNHVKTLEELFYE